VTEEKKPIFRKYSENFRETDIPLKIQEIARPDSSTAIKEVYSEEGNLLTRHYKYKNGNDEKVEHFNGNQVLWQIVYRREDGTREKIERFDFMNERHFETIYCDNAGNMTEAEVIAQPKAASTNEKFNNKGVVSIEHLDEDGNVIQREVLAENSKWVVEVYSTELLPSRLKSINSDAINDWIKRVSKLEKDTPEKGR